MALRVLMLRKRIDDARKRLEALRGKGAEYDKRAKELETAIAEAKTPDEQRTVEEAVATYDTERAAHDQEVSDLEAQLTADETELADLERSQESQPQTGTDNPGAPAQPSVAVRGATTEQRGVHRNMNIRAKILRAVRSIPSLMEREDVKSFIGTIREAGTNRRAITNAGLLVPTIVLDVLRENIIDYSKLYRHVNAQYIPGQARVPVMGAIPEAVWTEMCAILNELALSFGVVDMDGYKVGGYIAVCNAVLADTDENLLVSIIDSLGQSIGLALDKAILYGTGTKMPLGIVTRLAQTAKPSDYPATAPAWEDLHTSNILSISAANSTGTKLYQALIKDMAAAKGKYSRGEKFWAMNETTYSTLVAEGMSVNAAGAIVSALDGNMPVIGGIVEVLSFIPNNVIIGGYGDLYFLAERQGTTITSSEHVQFIQDQTVFKGVARYDGTPVIPNGFVAIGINGVTPKASDVTFAPDTANTSAPPEESA